MSRDHDVPNARALPAGFVWQAFFRYSALDDEGSLSSIYVDGNNAPKLALLARWLLREVLVYRTSPRKHATDTPQVVLYMCLIYFAARTLYLTTRICF